MHPFSIDTGIHRRAVGILQDRIGAVSTRRFASLKRGITARRSRRWTARASRLVITVLPWLCILPLAAFYAYLAWPRA